MKPASYFLVLILSLGMSSARAQTLTTAREYSNRAYAKYQAGDLDGAIADYTKAIEIDPRYAAAYGNRGAMRETKGDLDGAIRDYSKFIEMEGRFAPAYYNRAHARKARGDLDGAISDYTKTVELDPRHASAYYNRANARKAKGDLNGAIADYSEAIEINPRHRSAYFNRGNTRTDKGDFEGAVADYTKTIEIDPNHSGAYNALAWQLATAPIDSLRDGRKAIEYARRAVELTSWKDPGYVDTLAAAYAEASDFSEAIRWQEKALSFAEFEKSEVDKARGRLQLYRVGKPYHANK